MYFLRMLVFFGNVKCVFIDIFPTRKMDFVISLFATFKLTFVTGKHELYTVRHLSTKKNILSIKLVYTMIFSEEKKIEERKTNEIRDLKY